MRQASKRVPDSAEKTVRDIRRATRRHHSAEEKIRIVLEGLRGEHSIAELCRKEGINQNLAILSSAIGILTSPRLPVLMVGGGTGSYSPWCLHHVSGALV